MRKIQQKSQRNILFAAIFSTVLLFSGKADAFFGLFFGGPVFEPTSTAAELGKNISTALTELSAEADKLKQQIANAFTAKALNFNSNFNLRLEHKPIAGAKILEEPAVDPLNESEVKKYIYKLFLTYPAHDIPTQVKYRKMAQDFYDDSVLEAYSAAREVEKYLSNDVAAKFAALQSRLHESGGDGASSPEALNEALYNNYLAYQTIDTISRVLQELTAIKAQLEAARAINDIVEPLEYPDPDPALQGALNFDNLPKLALNGYFSLSGHSMVAGADAHITKKTETTPQKVTMGNGTVIENIDENTVVEVNVEKKKVNPLCTQEPCEYYEYNEDADMYKPFEGYSTVAPGGIINFSQSDDPILEHPFYDAKYKMNEMTRMEFIYDKITTAINIHNLIKKIRLAQDDFESYKRVVALHEKALRMLRLVDKCAVTMLSNNFSDAPSVWCGQAGCDNVVADYTDCPVLNFEDLSANSDDDCSEDVSADYAARSGVSGWALDQYDLARAAISSGENYNVSTVPAPTEDDIHTKDLDNVEKEGIPYAEKVSGAVLDETAQYEAEARKSQLLPWEIGAIAAKTLAENPGTWGTLSNPYPVWNDQKNFYSQYLDGKYINLPQYLQFLGQEQIFELALPVANTAALIAEVNAAKAALESAIAAVNSDKDMKAEDKTKEIQRLKEETAKKIEQLKNDKAANDAAIPSVVSLSRDDTYPNLWELNAEEDGLLAGSLKSVLGDSVPSNDGSIISKTILNKFKEEVLPGLLSERGLELGNISASGGGTIITMSRVIGDAQSLTAGFIESMKAQIKAMRESMCALGDNLYYSVGTAPSMHQSMMQALAAVVYEVSDAELGVSAGMTPWKTTISRLDISEDDKTFIGVKPLTDREAKAPRAPLQMGYPPVREIFHFDDYDYEHAAPGSRKSFVAYGGEVPELWKEILADKPFVQKDIDLTKILDSGVGTNTLLRGGQFPCNLTASLVGNEDKCIDNTIYNVEHKRECAAAAEEALAAGNTPGQCLKNLHCGNDYFGTAVIGGLDSRAKSMENIVASLTSTAADYAGGEVNPCINYSLNLTEEGNRADSSKFFIWDKWPLYNETAGAGFTTVKDDYDPTLGRSELGIFLQTPASGSLSQIVTASLEVAKAKTLKDKTIAKGKLQLLMNMMMTALGNDASTETKFRKEMAKIYDRLIEIIGKNNGDESALEESDDSDDPSPFKVKKTVMGYMPFQQNQVGGFLNIAETERDYRESRKQLEKDIRQLEFDLAQTLDEIGYQLSNAFSLLNTDDWRLSMSTLDETKNKLLTEIDTRIKNVKVSDNKIVKYRLREFNRMLMALNKDNQELVTIAEGVDSGPNFDEIIKMEEANAAVREEYRKKEEEAFRQAMKDLGNIYCANYNEGAYDRNMCRFPIGER